MEASNCGPQELSKRNRFPSMLNCSSPKKELTLREVYPAIFWLEMDWALSFKTEDKEASFPPASCPPSCSRVAPMVSRDKMFDLS